MTKFSNLIYLHQIFYQTKQCGNLDSSLIPFDNSLNPRPEWHEYHTFLTEYESNNFDENAYYGYVSWKFQQKTGVTGEEFLGFVRSNPGADVYFINPFHSYSLCFKNVWTQGEYFHPGLIEIADEAFHAIDWDFSLQDMVNDESDTAFCNYWVAKPDFWREYVPIIKQLLDLATYLDRSSLTAKLNIPVPRHASATYLTFILERVFSSLLWKNSINACAYHFSEDWLRQRYGILYEHIPMMRSLKSREKMRKISIADQDLVDAYRRLFIQYKDIEFSQKQLDKPWLRRVQRLSEKLPQWSWRIK